MKWNGFVLLAMLMFVVSNVAWAEIKPNEALAGSDIPEIMKKQLRSVNYEEEYVAKILRIIRNSTSDKKALTAADIQEKQRQDIEKSIRSHMTRFTFLDGNYDGEITPEEIQEVYQSQKSTSRSSISNTLDTVMSADEDRDGSVTMKEMAAHTQKIVIDQAKKSGSHQNQLNKWLALDPNGDGKLTSEELKKLAIKAFSKVDVDGDGVIGKEEKQILYPNKSINRRSVRRNMQAPKTKIEQYCAPIPLASNDEKVALISVYEGDSVSTVSVAGQVGETNVIPVQIDEGDDDIYLIAVSHSPTIWQLKGKTRRVSKFVIVGPSMPPGSSNNDSGGDKINVGATGIAREKISFRHGRTCKLQWSNASPKSLEPHIGRKPDLFLKENSVAGIHIFGERINTGISEDIKKSQIEPPEGFEPNLWKKHLRFMPGGVIDLRQEDIISDAPAAPYEILPKWAGFSKLAHEGAIVPASYNRNGKSINEVPVFGGSHIKIIKDIPFYPAGLHGGFSADITIAKGVQIPRGSPGHSKVKLEETGEIIDGPFVKKNR